MTAKRMWQRCLPSSLQSSFCTGIKTTSLVANAFLGTMEIFTLSLQQLPTHFAGFLMSSWAGSFGSPRLSHQHLGNCFFTPKKENSKPTFILFYKLLCWGCVIWSKFWPRSGPWVWFRAHSLWGIMKEWFGTCTEHPHDHQKPIYPSSQQMYALILTSVRSKGNAKVWYIYLLVFLSK